MGAGQLQASGVGKWACSLRTRIIQRSRRALPQGDRDRPKAMEVGRFETRLRRLLEALTPRTSAGKREALEELFWLIEEYKVSIFAQELKTAVPVSAKQLEKKIGEIGRML